MCPVMKAGKNKKRKYVKRELRHTSFYNTKAWRSLRNSYMDENPLCEMCLKEDKVTPGVICHHIKHLKDYPELGLEPTNMMSLCMHCHSLIHKEKESHH